MKKPYNAPSIEKLEFDYTNVVVASGRHGDNGNGHGCAGAPISGQTDKVHAPNKNKAC